jgi:hypothetical protein
MAVTAHPRVAGPLVEHRCDRCFKALVVNVDEPTKDVFDNYHLPIEDRSVAAFYAKHEMCPPRAPITVEGEQQSLF